MTTLTGLAWSNNKENKTRSILVITSCMLTTLLLTVIATFGYWYVKSERTNAGENYGHYYGIFGNLNDDKIKELERHSKFTDLGRYAPAGGIDSDKVNLSIAFADDTCMQLTNMNKKLAEGRYPEKEDEIAAQPGFFRSLGIQNVQVGDTVTFSCRPDLNSFFEPVTMTVSGIISETENELEAAGYNGYVSRAFYENYVPEESKRYHIYFRLDETVDINADNAEEVLTSLAEECGIGKQSVIVNKAYLRWSLDPGIETIMGCAVVAVLVILFSVAVIYNIFQVGIVQKIQEYGKLKALGATKKQIKKVVFCEGMLLAAIGIPCGLITGYPVSELFILLLTKEAGEFANEMLQIRVSPFSAPLLSGVAVISFLTVWAALKKPMKITAAISPIEAVRYQENVCTLTGREGKEKGIRKGKNEVSVVSMTMANLSANRKRMMTTIFTMGLSSVLFVVMANLTGNMDAEFEARRTVEYGKFKITLNYSLGDKAYPENNLDAVLQNNPFSETIIEQIKSIEGVHEIKIRKIAAVRLNGRLMSAGVLDRDLFERNKEAGALLGRVDYEQAAETNGILFGWSFFLEENGYGLDMPLSLLVSDGEKEISFDTQIMGSFGSADYDWVITEETYQSLGLSEKAVGCIWVDCEKNEEEAVGKALQDLLEDVPHVTVSTYKDAYKRALSSMRLMKIMIYSLLVVIGLIGFMNLANTMIISIITRKQEFGILQAVGMTNGQLNKSLQMEGLILTAGITVISMLVGIPGGYAFFRYGKSVAMMGLHNYHFPIAEVFIMLAAIGMLQLLLSFTLSRNVKKESLIERIRYQ